MSTDAQRTHKDLLVWKMAMQLAQDTYVLTGAFPKEELYGLMLQTRRAAVSIPSNIAEGAARTSTPEFKHYVRISLGSLAELETQLLLAHRMGFVRETNILTQVEEVRKMLLSLIRSLRKKLLMSRTSRSTHHPSPITHHG